MIYFGSCPDYHEMNFLKHYLRVGDGFVDVGANVGSYTLLAASLIGSRGYIDAFEPGPKSNPRLLENVKLNRLESVVNIHTFAVGNISGPAMYRCAQDATNRLRAPRDKDAAMEVMCVRLDDVLKSSYALGKIDIEGAEPLAFQGAEDHLRKSNPPVWIVEMNAKLRDFGFSEEGFAAWLNDRGWDLTLYDSDYRVLTVGGKPWLSDGMNVFAIARSGYDLLKQRIQNLSIKTLVQ
jgi:FkbM family methyltransferase